MSMNPNDYDEDGNNIVPCPICMSNYNPCKDGGKCPEEDEFIREAEARDFIKKQQELAREEIFDQWPYTAEFNKELMYPWIDTLIQQVITNTGEELVRLIEIKHTREMQAGENRAKYLAFQRGEEHMRRKALDTIKQHITAITNVE